MDQAGAYDSVDMSLSTSGSKNGAAASAMTIAIGSSRMVNILSMSPLRKNPKSRKKVAADDGNANGAYDRYARVKTHDLNSGINDEHGQGVIDCRQAKIAPDLFIEPSGLGHKGNGAIGHEVKRQGEHERDAVGDQIGKKEKRSHEDGIRDGRVRCAHSEILEERHQVQV